MVELAIDTAGELASIALSQEGQLLGEMTWRCRRNHSAELMPAVATLMERLGADKGELKAVFVCLGPGAYMGLRVGVSVAKGLAFALSIPLVGVGRLEVDAYQQAPYPGPLCPLHEAGRGQMGHPTKSSISWGPQMAWALYGQGLEGWQEHVAPHLSSLEELLEGVPPGCLFCGDISEGLAAALKARRPGAAVARAVRRAGSLAELGWRRLRAGGADDPATIKPLYLRAPVVGPASTQ